MSNGETGATVVHCALCSRLPPGREREGEREREREGRGERE